MTGVINSSDFTKKEITDFLVKNRIGYSISNVESFPVLLIRSNVIVGYLKEGEKISKKLEFLNHLILKDIKKENRLLKVKTTSTVEVSFLINNVSQYLQKTYAIIEQAFFDESIYPEEERVFIRLTCDIDQEKSEIKQAIYTIMEYNEIEEMEIV